MKTTLAVLLLLGTSPVWGQFSTWRADDTEDINSRVMKLNLPKEEVDLHLSKFHKQRSTGTLIALGGVALTAGSLWFYHRHDNDNTDDGDNNRTDYKGAILGGAMMVVGGVIRFDAYKFLKTKKHRK